jgi:lysozyme family protein
MTTPFDAFSTLVDQVEGTTLDMDPRDAGNWTGGEVGFGELRGSLRGVSAKAYPTLDIANLTDEQIRVIRLHDYWQPLSADSLPAGPNVLLADEGYNQGNGAASRDLQAAVGVPQDGVIGPVTCTAARNMRAADLLAELQARRGLRYAHDADLSTFGLGWFRRLSAACRAATSYL